MAKYVSTFMIGFFASLCAVFVPRMVAMLNGGHIEMQYFPRDFILVGLVFSLVIGGITVIFQQGRKKSAAEVFMTALGIPALLAGALSSGATGNNLNDLQAVNQRLSESLAQKSDISIEEKSTNITPLETIPSNTLPPVSGSGFPLISDAHAQTGGAAPESNQGLKLGIQVEQASYLIVLGEFSSKTEAMQKAAELRKIVPKATAVQSNQSFLVIDSEKPRSKSEALLKAINLQKTTGLKPYLLQAK